MIPRALKPVDWIGSSYGDLKSFPAGAQHQLGFELYRVQAGSQPTDFKPMRSIGSSVFEIRAHVDGEHRLIYVAKFEEAVYVLHAFRKKSQKTTKRDIETARRRLAVVESQRRNRPSSR